MYAHEAAAGQMGEGLQARLPWEQPAGVPSRKARGSGRARSTTHLSRQHGVLSGIDHSSGSCMLMGLRQRDLFNQQIWL